MSGRTRANNEGSFPCRQRPDGRWEAKLNLGKNSDGRRLRKSFYGATRKEAIDALLKARAKLQMGQLHITTEKAPILADFLMRWLETVVKPSRALKTYHIYRSHCRIHIVPALGGIKLDKLGPMEVQAFIAQLQARGLAPESQRGIFATLQSALSQAVEWQLIVVNPCSRVKRPRVPKVARDFWDVADMATFLSAARNDPYGTLYLVALSTGMRAAEIIGLRRVQVDLNAAVLQVTGQLVEVNGQFDRTPPKSGAGLRTIPLPPATVTALRLHFAHLDATGRSESPLVFPDTQGGPLRYSNFIRRSFHPLVKRAGVKRITFHGLRHTFASQALGHGVDVKTVAEILGHADPALTLRIYAHALPGNKRAAADKMQQLLAPASPAPKRKRKAG